MPRVDRQATCVVRHISRPVDAHSINAASRSPCTGRPCRGQKRAWARSRIPRLIHPPKRFARARIVGPGTICPGTYDLRPGFGTNDERRGIRHCRRPRRSPDDLAGVLVQRNHELCIVAVSAENQHVLEQDRRTAGPVYLKILEFRVAPDDAAIAPKACGPIGTEVRVNTVAFHQDRRGRSAIFFVATDGRRKSKDFYVLQHGSFRCIQGEDPEGLVVVGRGRQPDLISNYNGSGPALSW